MFSINSPLSIGQLTLDDDANHSDVEAGDAVFTTRFLQTAEVSSYKIFFQGQGYNERDELTPRVATRYVSLQHPRPDGGDEECILCDILKWLWALAIFLLLLSLLCCNRKRRG